jgi:HEPN domain-containing protein
MPPITEHYEAAAARHYRDSQQLQGAGAADNAAYLAGYVVECVFKALLHRHGFERPQLKGYGHDLSALSGDALRLAMALSPALRRYPLDRFHSVARAASSWVPELRYATDSVLNPTQQAQIHAGADEAVARVLVELLLDGRGQLSP